MPCSTPMRRHRRRGEERQEEFARAFAPDGAQSPHVDHSDRDGEHDAGQHAMRQILQRTGQKQQHDQHDGGEGELGDLAARARLVRHRRLGRAAVDHERPADRRRGVGGRQAQNVRVLVDVLAVNGRVHARRRRALRDDHDEARPGDRQQRDRIAPAHIRPFERRQAAGDRADDGKAVVGEMKPRARRDRPDDERQRHRKTRREPAAEQDAGHDEDRQAAALRAERPRLSRELPQLPGRAVRSDADAQHAAEHGDADLNPDAGQKSGEDGARKEVGEKTELEDARRQQQARGQQRQHADQRHVLRAGERRHAGQRAGEYRRGRGIGRHDQMAGRPEQREARQRQQNRVEAGDDGRAGDAGVAEHLRDVHRGERQAGEHVPQRRARLDRKETAEKVDFHSLALARPPQRALVPPSFLAQASCFGRRFIITMVGRRQTWTLPIPPVPGPKAPLRAPGRPAVRGPRSSRRIKAWIIARNSSSVRATS